MQAACIATASRRLHTSQYNVRASSWLMAAFKRNTSHKVEHLFKSRIFSLMLITLF